MTTPRQTTEDRLPPFSEEAERGVLGCLILNPKEGLGRAMEVIGTEGAEFYLPGHRTVWRGLLALDKAGMGIDSVTLYQWLSDAKQLEAAGGMEGLMGLTSCVPGASFLDSYLQIVGDKARLRRLIATCTAAVAEAFEATEDPAATTKVIERAQASVLDSGLQTGEQAVVPMRALTQQFMESVEFSVKHRNLGLIHGNVGSGFSYFDKKTCGFEPQTVTVISGRPSTGKTSWLCSMVLNVAVRQSIPVVFMSLEMSRKAIVERLACIFSRVNLKQLHQGMLTQQDFQRLSQGLPQLAKAPIWIDDGPGMTSDRLRTRARQLVLQHEARLVVVDHLHEIRHPQARGDAGMEAREATEALRWIAKSLKLPVVAAAQNNRESAREAQKSLSRRPQMTDIRDSGFVEQIADIIGILHIDEGAGQEESQEEDGRRGKQMRTNWNEEEIWPVNLEIVKQRNGPTGKVEFTFFRNEFRYEDRTSNTGSVAAGERRRAREVEGIEV